MAETVAETTVTTLDDAGQPAERGSPGSRRSGAQTEADKVRRQQLLRRKSRVVRHALAASRSR